MSLYFPPPHGPSSGTELTLPVNHRSPDLQIVDYAKIDRSTRPFVPLGVGCRKELEMRMIFDCSVFCAGCSRDVGEPICWEGYSVSEDHKVETQCLTDNRMAWFAALQVQDLAKTTFRGEELIEEWRDAQGNAAFPTSQEFLEGIILEIVGQLKWQRRQGFYEQQQELYKLMASVAWALKEKQSEEINANKPESERLEEDAEAADPETPPQPPVPLPPQQSLAAQSLGRLSPPEEVGGDEHEEVTVSSKNMVVGIGGVIAFDGGKGLR